LVHGRYPSAVFEWFLYREYHRKSFFDMSGRARGPEKQNMNILEIPCHKIAKTIDKNRVVEYDMQC